MNVREELHIAVVNGEMVTLQLHGDEFITGVAEVSTDPKRAKIQTSDGPIWIPYEEIDHVSMIGKTFH